MNHIDLQAILRKRLPRINRWGAVSCYKWNSKRLPWYIDPREGMFYIHWSQPKRRNPHEYEYKEVPLTDLKEVAERNRMRLRNNTKQYK